MVIFLYKDRHSYTHNSLINEEGFGEIQCKSYSWLLRQKKMLKATYIFTDRERMDLWELRIYGALFNHLQNAGEAYRAINDPAKMMNRRSLLRALYLKGINGFNAYSVTEKVSPKQFPVFLRREHDHGEPFTDLLYNQQELEVALKQLQDDREPEDGVLITEYLAEPISGTLFRKLSSYRVGDETFFYHCGYGDNWLVKYFTKSSVSDAEYSSEQKMILDNAFEKVITKVFEIAQIDYGRVDFGLVDGEIQVYEINTNPMTRPLHKLSLVEKPNLIQKENQRIAWEIYRKALSAVDTTDPSASFAPRFTHPDLYIPNKPLKLLFKDPLRFIKLLFCKDSSKPVIRR